MIAKRIGISRSYFYTWLNKYDEIKQAVKEGRRIELVEQEDALKKAGLGYKITVKKPIKLREEKQKAGEGKIVTERIEYADEELYFPPNVAALIFYLKNRAPDYWKDKPKENVEESDDPLKELLKRLNDETERDKDEKKTADTDKPLDS